MVVPEKSSDTALLNEPELLDQEMERVMLSVGIPPRPSILQDLAAEVKKDSPDFHIIEQLISGDVGLSAALLKTINSPFYGLRTKASSVKQAITLLGLSALTRVTTGMVLRKVFTNSGAMNMEHFWDASSKVALATSYIAKQLPGMNKDEAYTFGLFQNCGIPLLMQRFPDYQQTLSDAHSATDQKFTAVEDKLHPTNHATMGYLLTKSWHLPEVLSKAIRFHHEYDMLSGPQAQLPEESKNLVALALLAERSIQLEAGMNNSVEWFKGGPYALAHLGLSEVEYGEIAADVSQVLKEDRV